MLTLAASTAHAQSCGPDPLAGRALYLRGSFNAWNATDAQRMAWACDRWSVVTRLPAGEQAFKFGDEGWSAEADFGAASPDATRALLKSRGGVREFNRRFAAGTYRISLTMNHELRIETCPAEAAPLGATTLYLRGTMNNWAALDEFAFRFSCDAYYLNVKLDGRHEFKIADAAWTGATSYGAGQGAYLQEGGGNLARAFAGEHTLRLAWAGGRPELSIGPRTFADPQLQAVADPVARSLAFDSRALVHKAPFGAVVAGSELRFALDALPGIERLTLVVEKRRLEGNQEVLEYTELARVPMRRSPAASPAEAGRERWQASHRFGEVGVYGYWFEAEIGGRRYVVQNNRHPLHWTREKGTGGAAEVAELPAARGTIRRFRQTVYAADFKVPDWAADAVYYYIFPERFRNGDKTNDPQPGVAKYHDGTVERHAKWSEPPFKPGDGRGDDRHNNDFFGGDLAGIVDKLDYIRDLGANTIYMTPVFRAASNHKYDTADYKQIDPGFGSNADFERLTREAARRGMRVIPDASLNHVGQDSRYFDRFGNFAGGDAGPPQVSSSPRGGGSGADRPWGRRESGAFEGGRINAASPYFGWFSFDATQREPDKQYKGWVGIADLPELNKASPEFRRFAYRERDSVMKFWLDRGAAGWRMDVAPWVPDDFWREWRAEIKRHRPDALTVAETWFDSSKYFLGDMFDSTMNYVFRNAVLAWAAGGSAREMVEHLEAIREAYPPQAFHALMNLLSTHDAPRALHQFGWHEDTRDPARIAEAKRRLVLAAFFQMTYPGAPAIYYGDEVGVTGGEDPYNRATYPWADEGGSPDMALHAEFAKLVALRNAHAILRRGELLAPLHVDEHVVVLARRLG
ncbi:MAG TPA: glycoside hydrolase family 13 protein, partial [Burkholderiaceae bacterium]|nr:glycoside hydrolase family 13 protein [Burkholderiaceae bacterium]